MSTRQYQIYEDAVKDFEFAQEKMKAARKQFIDHVRVTGVEMRKLFITDNRDHLAAIATRTQEYIGEEAGSVLAMEVEVSSSRGCPLDIFKLQEIEYHLRQQGWKITQSYDDALGRGNYVREKRFYVCI